MFSDLSAVKLGQAKRFLIVRHDNLGDVALALPMAGALKRHVPECQVFFAVKSYAKDVVAASEHLDGYFVFDSVQNFERELQALKPDAVLFPFPSSELARAAFRQRVPFRVGTNRRWFHWLWCNLRPNLSRKRSPLHEAQLNLQLVEPFVGRRSYPLQAIPALAGLEGGAPPKAPNWPLVSGRCNVLLQVASNGHAVEWPLERFVELVRLLDPRRFNIIINGTPKEGEVLRALAPELFQFEHVTDATKGFTVSQLMVALRSVDGVVSSSTGPLHLAALVGARVLGLFVDRPAMSASRWGPLGKRAQVIQADKALCTNCVPSDQRCACMLSIGTQEVFQIVTSWAK